jgi:tRNA pseudouridine(38-40) synthase
MGGMEFLKLRVLGQSFLLHHIRKMVAVMIEMVRGRLLQADVQRAFGNEKVIQRHYTGIHCMLHTCMLYTICK